MTTNKNQEEDKKLIVKKMPIPPAIPSALTESQPLSSSTTLEKEKIDLSKFIVGKPKIFKKERALKLSKVINNDITATNSESTTTTAEESSG